MFKQGLGVVGYKRGVLPVEVKLAIELGLKSTT